MTGPRGSSESYFPETFNVTRDEAKGNIEVEGEKYSLFPMGPLIKAQVFVAVVFVKQWKIITLEGNLMVWANYMSACNSIAWLYFKGTCGVISVTMAMHM